MMFACKPASKVQKVAQPVSIADTTPVAEIKDTAHADSGRLAQEVYSKILKNKIEYTTFNGKVRIGYSSKEGSDDATAYVRLRRDSALWLSLRGALGIEGFRILVTRDSVKVLDLLKKTVQSRGISYIQEVTGLPFNFNAMQDLVVGNPVFIDSNIVSYNANNSNEFEIVMNGSIFRNLVTVDKNDYKILHSRLNDNSTVSSRTCNISLGGYEASGDFLFSTQRKISVEERSKLDVTLDFKQYSFNQPVSFPFSIPKNYKRL